MVDETDITEEKKWLYETRARTAIKNLQKRNINAQYISSREEALLSILNMIPPGVVVGRGDSISVDQVGVIPELIKRNQNKVIDPLEKDDDGFYIVAEREDRWKMAREIFFTDVFVVGTNAITLDGKLVNTDGWGNRVSQMIFGPEKVIVIAGANKIVKDVNEALERIRVTAAPMNVKRHCLKHHRPEWSDLPCIRTGSCVDCRHDYRICNYTVTIEGAQIQDKGRISVVLVGEELGI